MIETGVYAFSRMSLRQVASASALALVFCVAFAGQVQASIIPPGGSPNPFPPDIFAPCAGCTQLAYVTSGVVTSTNAKLVFTLNAAVYRDPGNIFGANDLDFVYQAILSPTSIDSIGRMTAIDFTGF